ncbi:MAG: hypothetical protein K1X94_04465 [Sandaracinaceae bacterium]|jgi:hypothetical protein|nr:hypothetical protein [Sandaracinaceae bacterium]
MKLLDFASRTLVTTALATAFSSVAAAQTASPAPLALDDAYLWFSVESVENSVDGHRVDAGFFPEVSARVWGAMPAQSALVFTYSRNGQQLARVRCTVDSYAYDHDPSFSHSLVEGCEDRDVRILGAGDLQVEIRAVDGQTDAETVLGTRTVSIQHVATVLGGVPPTAGADKYYVSHHDQIIDSVLFWHPENQRPYDHSYMGSLSGDLVGMLFTHSATDSFSRSAYADMNVRCQVDGQPLTTASSPLPANVEQQRYQLFQRQYLPPGSPGGTAIEEWKDLQVTVQMPFRRGDFATHPGHWVCDLRANGQNLRRWAWTVGADGLPQRHAEQTEGGLALGPRAILVETTVFADGHLDQRTSPTEVQRGGFYGRPWVSALARAQAAAVPAIGDAFMVYEPLRAAAAGSAGARGTGGRRRR